MSSRVLHRVDADGVGWIEFTAQEPGRVVLDSSALAGLRAAIDELGAGPSLAIVLTSAEPSVFVSGPDLEWLASLKDPPAACEYSRKGQRLFEAIEALGVPTLCAIDGLCVGPGLEIALACSARVASDARSTQIGFGDHTSPMIPCWGGCVRLPRLVGPEEALDLMVSGRLIDSHEALAKGYVDEVVPAKRFRSWVGSIALRIGRSGSSLRLEPQPADATVYSRMRDKVLWLSADRRAGAFAAVDVVERSVKLQRRAACEIETAGFGQLTQDESCRAGLARAAAQGR